MRYTEDNRAYFVDHNTRTTTFQDPRPGAKQIMGARGQYGIPMVSTGEARGCWNN